jgi:hypothetical protein
MRGLTTQLKLIRKIPGESIGDKPAYLSDTNLLNMVFILALTGAFRVGLSFRLIFAVQLRGH